MARSFDPKKIALWQGRFRRFLDSGLAVARFCVVKNVSESSFYYWQKKLGTQIEVGTEHLDAIRAVVAETVRIDQDQAAERNAFLVNPVARNMAADNQVTRNVSFDNQATRKARSLRSTDIDRGRPRLSTPTRHSTRPSAPGWSIQERYRSKTTLCKKAACPTPSLRGRRIKCKTLG